MSVIASGSGGGGIAQGAGTAIANDKIVRGDVTGIQGSTVTLSDEGAFIGAIQSVVALDDNYTLLATDSGRSFNIRLAGGPATITLLASPAQGYCFEVFVATTDEVTVQFVGSQVAYLGASPTSAAGTLKSSTKGSKVRICQEAQNLFSAVAVGTWAAA